MGQTNLRKSLQKRYAGLTGELEDVHFQIERIKREQDRLPTLEARIPDLESLIEATDLLLRDNDPDWDPSVVEPTKPWSFKNPIPFGQCGRRAMALLRETERPMTCRQITLELLRQAGETEPDIEAVRRVQTAVESSLRKFRGRTVESSGKYPAQWRAINKPEINFDP
ncbi:hypothetical protein [Erythrobacter rubeus]|uniref:Uncharacterized protein n=1 Tax=Erythrobacter rubeus TaxID=2760803 RepID=A0ABR8KKH9_9SPHN|nr:hypothetical protein [Erythrobacter rubeus]MBD2840774.1 hypothetical protein [Erythrobacter rubeus]